MFVKGDRAMKKDINEIDKVLHLDCRMKKNKIKLQLALREWLPPFKKFEKGKVIPLEDIEKVHSILTMKYCISMQWITSVRDEKNNAAYWSVCIREDDSYKFLGTVTAATLYELLAKAVLYMYGCINGMNTGGKFGTDTRVPIIERAVKESAKDDD